MSHNPCSSGVRKDEVKKLVRPQLTGLWRHPDFLKLWVGQTISLFGSQITALALPLTAVLNLQATPAQMGMLRATPSASAVLAGLFAGVWADRLRRRPILIGTDLGFAVIAGSIPVAAFLGLLRIEQLYLAQFFSGVGLIYSVFILYASRGLKIETVALGAIFAALGLGLLIGALAAERLARRYGVADYLSHFFDCFFTPARNLQKDLK